MTWLHPQGPEKNSYLKYLLLPGIILVKIYSRLPANGDHLLFSAIIF
ncbi:MAG: hypothetical protein ABIS01_11515 [Ferruginibacter sp.]